MALADHRRSTTIKFRMLHKTALERYQKLKKDFHRLMRHFNRDDLDNFVQTANSLHEWIKHGKLAREQRRAFNAFAVATGLDWQFCHQIANQQKHAGAKRPKNSNAPVVTTVEVSPGGKGFVLPPSMSVIGSGEEITIVYEGGAESALGFTIRVFRHFHYIFEVLPLPLVERAKAATMTPEFFGF